MKPKTLFKIVVDIVMLVLFLQLMFCYDVSPLFHEVMGMVIGALFAVHVAINWKAVRGLWRGFREGRLNPARTLLLISDLVLPVGMAVAIISGMLIATEVWLTPANPALVTVHNVASYTCLVILAGHTLLHARYLAGCFKQLLRGSFFQKAASCVGAAAMVVAMYGTGFAVALNDGAVSSSTSDTVAQQAYAASVNDRSATAAVSGRQEEATASGSGGGKTGKSASGTSTSTSSGSSATSSDTSNSGSTATSTDTTSDTSSVTQGTASTDDSSSTPICTACGKACPLTALRCNKGIAWAQQMGYL